MEKQEIFEKFTDFIKHAGIVEREYPEILEKHGVLDITSGFADKLDSIGDPFERLIVSVYCVDQLEVAQVEEMMALRKRHENLLYVVLSANKDIIDEVKKHFEKYISGFETVK